MQTKTFMMKNAATIYDTRWAVSISNNMADIWDTMIKQNKYDLLIWVIINTRCRILSKTVLRKLACQFVRETPLLNGHKVWDLLTNECSRKAVEVAEKYANRKTTSTKLSKAYDDAYYLACILENDFLDKQNANTIATYAAACSAHMSVFTAFIRCAYESVDAAAAVNNYEHEDEAKYWARAAQIEMIAKLKNPFK